MVRVAESWGILLLSVCTIVVMVHLALSLAKARMRRERTRFGALAGLFAALTILANPGAMAMSLYESGIAKTPI